jgi:serine/threonine protein phosphatase 1
VALGSILSRSAATDKGERIYAIGDVHGCYDQLRELLAMIEAHNATLPPCRSLHVILLGDLVDRGPASAEVLRFLHNVQQRTDRIIVLQGNHEELMLKALDGEPGMLRAWMRIGGDATLRSFGIEPPPKDMDPREALETVRAAVPAEWVTWLRALPLTARSGDYLFCHAGIRPGVPLKRQTRADLLWIRDEFLEDEETRHEVMVVHGHSIAAEVEMRTSRIGIDTGAYRTGVLTALCLEGSRREILATGAASAAA